jgi:PQQ-dependent catabolism-associated CXXCW motif protein
MTARPAAAAVIGLVILGSGVDAAEPDDDFDVPEPPGYRTQDYRAPVPRRLAGARVVSTADAAALWRQGGAVFIDVLPQPPRPRNLPAGTIWREAPRFAIPGSLWLPDTGYGELAPVTERYFAAGLARASGGDLRKPLVFYCLKDCWMSWNAAKRALAMGYSDITWYPDGTDGWQAAGLPLAEIKPEPRGE